LGKCDHVHVAFDDQDVAALAQRLSGFEQAVEFAALAEYRRLRRIEVLGLALVEYAAPEPDHLTLHRADREHDAVAEPVVALAIGLVAFAGVAGDHKTAFLEQGVVVLREHARKASPGRGRVAQAESRRDLASESAPLQIRDRAWAGTQLALVVCRGTREHLTERFAPLLEQCRPFAFGRRCFVFGHRDPELPGQFAHGVRERQSCMLH
jgi:hypothetical protein